MEKNSKQNYHGYMIKNKRYTKQFFEVIDKIMEFKKIYCIITQYIDDSKNFKESILISLLMEE